MTGPYRHLRQRWWMSKVVTRVLFFWKILNLVSASLESDPHGFYMAAVAIIAQQALIVLHPTMRYRSIGVVHCTVYCTCTCTYKTVR